MVGSRQRPREAKGICVAVTKCGLPPKVSIFFCWVPSDTFGSSDHDSLDASIHAGMIRNTPKNKPGPGLAA
jgi:hypothetical protein